MKKIKMSIFAFASLFIMSCATTLDMETINTFDESSEADSLEEELEQNEAEERGFLIQEELKVQDVEQTIVYVDRPVYIPVEAGAAGKPQLTGLQAVNDSQKRAVQKPENYKNGTFFYQFNEDFVFEVYAQPYHLTDIILEKGEVVIGTPLLSEDDSVWELTAGVAKDAATGEDIQHLFVKPTYSKQDSSMVIITDRRVYHFRLKSFSTTHMAMVKFTYPLERNMWAKNTNKNNGRSIENDYLRTSNPELLSFDYTIKYSKFKKPEFLPERVYDDGQRTYIQVNDIVLQKQLPVFSRIVHELFFHNITHQ